jgi:GAF domain-containing protein
VPPAAARRCASPISWSDRRFRALGLYRDFYRHAGTSYQAAITVPAPHHGLIGMAVNRQHRDFTDDEAELLNLLRPHIQQAAAISHLLDEPAQRRAARSTAIPR